MMANRRALLALLGGSGLALTAGCLGDITEAGNDDDDNGSSDQNDSNENGNGSDHNDAVEMTLAIGEVDDDPHPLSFDLDMISDKLSETEIPRLDITVENTGDDTATWTQTGSEFAFPSRGTDDGISIGLENEIAGALMDADGCARTEFGIERDDITITTELEPGESIEQRYAMAGSDVNLDDACPPTGSYRADYQYDQIGTWGFEFQLTK